MQANETIHWHTVRGRSPQMSTSYTTFDPHPGDWEACRRKGMPSAEFMAGRFSDLQQMEKWLGDGPAREGILERADLERPEHHCPVAVRVADDVFCTVSPLNWTGLANVVTDIITENQRCCRASLRKLGREVRRRRSA